MKVYGAEICKDCRAFKAEMAARGVTIDYTEITQDIPSLRAFLALRDTAPCFEEIRREGRVGIPVFVNDDGTVTLNADEALAWIGQPPMPAAEEGGCAFCG